MPHFGICPLGIFIFSVYKRERRTVFIIVTFCPSPDAVFGKIQLRRFIVWSLVCFSHKGYLRQVFDSGFANVLKHFLRSWCMRHHELEDLRVTIMDKVAEWQVVRYQINGWVDKVSKGFYS